MDSGSTSTPDANRLRVISDTGQNLRHDIDDAAAPKTTAHGVLAPTGNLGVNAGPSAEFDIHYQASDRTNHGSAALAVDGKWRFHEVGVRTGNAALFGAFPTARQVLDVVLPLNQR
ncbi:DUF4394 domain-containing protein [Streptomyces sp. bgisy082]|uniref:DUF4394 domain-containing protein n=1 Tax=Streptomyces sp. bgisy082 TaxID=3413776 RepID=UPI003D722E56